MRYQPREELNLQISMDNKNSSEREFLPQKLTLHKGRSSKNRVLEIFKIADSHQQFRKSNREGNYNRVIRVRKFLKPQNHQRFMSRKKIFQESSRKWQIYQILSIFREIERKSSVLKKCWKLLNENKS